MTMGIPGRIPLTNEEKALRGDPGRRGMRVLMKFDDLQPEAPDGMSDLAADEWDRVTPSLIANKVVGYADSSVLVAYCEAVANVRRIEARLCEASPALGVAYLKTMGEVHARAVATLVKLAEQFGLTPLSRQRVSLGSTKLDDDDNPDGILPPA